MEPEISNSIELEQRTNIVMETVSSKDLEDTDNKGCAVSMLVMLVAIISVVALQWIFPN
jgi:hypothetical protein